MKNIIRILLAAAMMAAAGEVSAQSFLQRVGRAVERAADAVDEAAQAVDETFNGSTRQQQQQQTRRPTPREAAEARMVEQEQQQQQSGTQQQTGGQRTAAPKAPSADPWISLGGAGPFQLGVEWKSGDGFTVAPLENGDYQVNEDATGRTALTYYDEAKQIEIVSPYFKLDEGVSVGSTLAGMRGVMGEGWLPFRVLNAPKQRLILVAYSYGLYTAFKVEDLADGGVKWDAERAAGRSWLPTLDDFKPDARIVSILIIP